MPTDPFGGFEVPPSPPPGDLTAARARSPWPEAVAYTSTRTAGDVSAALYADGVYNLGTRQVSESNGVYLSGDLTATLPNPLPGGLGRPKPRDILTWDGTAYTVVEVPGRSDWFPGAPFWRVVARNPVISYDLRETLTVKRPASAPGAGGLRAVGSYATAATGDGRLQITGVDAEPDTAGKLATRTRADVFLAGAVLVSAGDVVEQANATRWEVVGEATYDSLGLLTTLRVTRLT